MAETKAIAANPVRRRNSMTLINVGNANPIVTKNLDRNEILGYHNANPGNTVKVISNYISKGVTAGRIGSMTSGKYVIIGNTPELAGVASTVLKNSSSLGVRKSIHKIEGITTLLQVTAGWKLDGTFVAAPSTSSDDFGKDHAARPTRTVPGEFTYTSNGMPKDRRPTSGTYKPLQNP